MATPYSEIFTKANILFEDADLLSRLTDAEYTELLELFLSKAKSVYFKKCKKDLTDVNDTLKQFNETLDDQEQWIIGECMKLVWYEKQVFKEEKLRDKIGTKDYDRKSPGNLLDKLLKVREDTQKSVEEKINSYTFDDFTGFN